MTQDFSDPPLMADENEIDTSEQDIFVFPASFAQQRLWFLDQLLPGKSLYNIPAALRLNGALNVASLERSFNEIVRRHEALRTTFIPVNDEPVQVITPAFHLTLPLVDLRELPETKREAQALRLAIEEAQQLFNLAQGPLLRATLLQLGEQEYVLLFTMHHIISDGWSMGVLIRELVALYEVFISGTPSPLPELSIQYVDFAIWQQQWLQGEVLEAQLAYWKQQLAGAPAFLALPTDRPRPPVQTFQGATQSFQLPKSLSVALKALSQSEGVTLFMTLLAAFKVLLYRYTGQSNILVGSLIANRNRAEIEGLIGFFVNTLVLRNDLSGSPSFLELLQRVRETTLSAYAHQDLPFEKLVEELKPQRDLSYTPLFQVMFVLQNAPMPALEIEGLTLTPMEFDNQTAKFDLTLSMMETEQGLQGSLQYNTDLFDTATITRMSGHYQTLLQAIAADPQQPITTLPILINSDRHLLGEWNYTQQDYPQDQCVQQLFETQVEKNPDALAVVFGSEQLTYQQLNQRANQLAHYLQTLGVGAEVLVAICVERSLEMVIGLLAILKAGGAYLPLDPAYPNERLSWMLTDAQPAVLLTQKQLIDKLPEHQAHTVYLDTYWYHTQESQQNPICAASIDNLVYVIYTSGSTGRPKGVQITHAGLLNLVYWHQRSYRVTPDDRATQLAGVAFDASVWELWPYITAGASVYLLEEEIRTAPVQLRDWLISKGITISFLPTLLAENILLLDWPKNLALRILLTGGDKLHHYPSSSLPFKLVNNYGPTESTVVATSGLVPVKEEFNTSPAIGRPIANTQIYLLDANLQLVPIGVPGELHISGAGLARNYLNRPDLTNEKFIANPFSQESGAKLYKTGDLARYLPDGNIEFLGRIDNQVKIRGFRIELGEIEAVLSQNPFVQDAVVIVWGEVSEDKRLVAYVVSHQEQRPTVNELRHWLQKQLPEYMVPAIFMFLDTLPLTPNGKVDRRNLPTPELINPELESILVAPRTPTEEKLADIWAQVLGLERVGVYHNFFELGGHSLLATQVISRIQREFRVDLPLRSLFESPTLAGLAETIETVCNTKQSLQAPPIIAIARNRNSSVLRQQSVSPYRSPLVAIQPVGTKQPLFCIHAVGGNVFCYMDLAHYLGLDQPLYGLKAPGLEGEQEPYTQVQEMVFHYIQAIRSIQPEGPYLLAGWSMGGILAFEMAQQLHAQGQKIDLLAVLDVKAMTFSDKPATKDDENLSILSNFVQELGVSLDKLSLSLDYFFQLQPDAQLVYVFEQAKISDQLFFDLDLQLVRHLFHVFKTNVQAMWNYRPQTYSGQITLLKAQEQLVEEDSQNSTMGWDKLAQSGVNIHVVPGNHYTMLRKPHVEFLAEQLKTCL
ncbi:amino acid adenylation domain-containing protein [Nostoc sp.]|uniref:non-ribosomal peptide synthetase n=1 Tax=Nostoc sp. TaxID=1180 RepID=UPI00359314B1